MARHPSSTNRRFGTGNFQRPRTFGSGGSSHPTRLSNLQRTGSFGRPNRQSNANTAALHQPRAVCIKAPCPGGGAVARQTGGQAFDVSHLPKANSIGSAHTTGAGGTTHPFNIASLPKPNSLGSPHGTANALGTSHATANNGATHPFNVANLPKANSLRTAHEPANTLGSAHETANKGTEHAFNIANLPKPNALASTHAAANGVTKPELGTQKTPDLAKTHDLAKKTSAEGAVVTSAEKVGGDKEQLKDDKNKSAADAKNLKTDTAADQKAKNDFNAADKSFLSAENKLNADKKANAPKAIIASDATALKNAQSKLLKADTNLLNDNSKLASDKNASAADKKTVAADQKVLQQDKATLSDKQKIAKQSAEISKLKTAEGSKDQTSDNGQGSNNQQQDNGQGSNNQSSDNGQSPSAGGGDSQSASPNSGSAAATGTGGNSDAGRTATVIDNSVRGAAVVTGATALLPDVTPAARLAPLPVPVVAPQQLAAVGPADADPSATPAAGPTVVVVVFQKDVSNDDIAAFLKAYDASIADGPNPDGLYKLQLSDQVPADQVQQVLDSMKSQTSVVLSAAAN